MGQVTEDKIYEAIEKLLDYGEATGLMASADRLFVANQLFKVLKLKGRVLKTREQHLDSPQDVTVDENRLESLLDPILNWAFTHGLLESLGADYADLLDSELMGSLMGRPSETIRQFNELYKNHPEKATTFLYNQGKASNYIRMNRIAKNIVWQYGSSYGNLDITINLSKPEKDPKAIAASKLLEQQGDEKYPSCLLCKENEGYAGTLNHPARQNLRLIPIDLNQEQWLLQYSPYVYYNEHCIVLSAEHIPMKLSRETYQRLIDFVSLFPHYFIGSNADLPIVGGSILTHDHYQGGGYEFAMARSEVECTYPLIGGEGISVGRVKWPMSVIRISGQNQAELVELAWQIHQAWTCYSDVSADVLHESEGIPHNTITPIARFREGLFELDLVLRNNRTTDQYPDGIYHPHRELHHIKKENIGLIEVMGLAVLPGRLDMELNKLEALLLQRVSVDVVESDLELNKHSNWYEELLKLTEGLSKQDVHVLIKAEVGRKFELVLEHAGVFKRTEAGFKQFDRFINSLSVKAEA